MPCTEIFDIRSIAMQVQLERSCSERPSSTYLTTTVLPDYPPVRPLVASILAQISQDLQISFFQMAEDESNVSVQAADASKNALSDQRNGSKILDVRDSEPHRPSKTSVYKLSLFEYALLLKAKWAFGKYIR
jgi:hypothetical protein